MRTKNVIRFFQIQIRTKFQRTKLLCSFYCYFENSKIALVIWFKSHIKISRFENEKKTANFKYENNVRFIWIVFIIERRFFSFDHQFKDWTQIDFAIANYYYFILQLVILIVYYPSPCSRYQIPAPMMLFTVYTRKKKSKINWSISGPVATVSQY